VNADKQKQLYPNKDAKIIKKIFELFVYDGKSQLEIIRIMRQRHGFKISSQMLTRLLRTMDYCGWLPDIHNENNGEPIKAIHEPIISEKLYYSAIQKLDDKKRRGEKLTKDNPLYPLRCAIYCPECGK
jgi:hypothetical protein